MENVKLTDKDKLYIVYYLNVGSLNNAKACQMMYELHDHLERMYDDTVNIIIVPVHNSESRVEMFNAANMDADENIEKLNAAAAALNKFILRNLTNKEG